MASLEIASSNLVYPARIVLFGLHGLGTVFGLAYKSKTPDLYPNSSHHGVVWTLSAILVLESVLSIVKRVGRKPFIKATFDTNRDLQPLMSSSSPFRESDESLDDNQRRSAEQTYMPAWRQTQTNRRNAIGPDSHARWNFPSFPWRATSDGRPKRPFSWKNGWSRMISAGRFVPIAAFTSSLLLMAMIVLAFVSICTGIVTMAGIFVSSSRLLHLNTPLTKV